MELAKTLLKLWSLRLWIAIGAVLAVAAAVASLTMAHSKVYSTASTQLIVDAPHSALGDAQKDLTPFTARAFVFARLMTTSQALQYIGQSAGLPGNLIAASGPTELTGPQATHTPTAQQGIQLTSAPANYKLNFLQNPQLPTVDIYAQAPTTKQAIALANGAVSGFSAYMTSLDNQSAVPSGQRIAIRQLGSATGGVVDAGASKSLAVMAFAGVFLLWCCLVLFVNNLAAQLRSVRTRRSLQDAAPVAAAAAPLRPAAERADSPAPVRALDESDRDVPEYLLRTTSSGNGAGNREESRRDVWVRHGS